MTSTPSSLFSSALATSQLEVPEEIQRPSDFGSTQTELLFIEDEGPHEPGLDLSRVAGYDLPRDRKKLKSFI
jgi:hypothetical protein